MWDYFALFTLISIKTHVLAFAVGLPLSVVSTYLVEDVSFKVPPVKQYILIKAA
jgi:hypothetical protein